MPVENATVFARGYEGIKTYKGKSFLATPVAYFDDLEMGLGVEKNDNKEVIGWGLHAPQMVLPCYRGMKMIELIDEFEPNTFAGCWYAANTEIRDCDEKTAYRAIEKLGKAYIDLLPKKMIEAIKTKDLNTILLSGLVLDKIENDNKNVKKSPAKKIGEIVRMSINRMEPENPEEMKKILENNKHRYSWEGY